jgi:DivIVA domain-containing protein
MALTPEDVVNKRFQPTKFREGYDQDEVDDFLDEVVVELRRLGQENEELRQRVIASDSRIAELQRNGQSGGSYPTDSPVESSVSSAPATAALTYPVVPVPAPDVSDQSTTNNLLQLARRLHDEHVREGIEKRDALIAEGHATAARVVAEAEAKQRSQIGSLEQERSALEHSIEGLKTFEHEYRVRLKSHLEDELRRLDSPYTNSGGAKQSNAGSPFGSLSATPDGSPVDAAQPQSFPGFGG